MSDYPVRYHDHPRAAVELPEYHEARAALDRLVKATVRESLEIGSQEDWIAMVADMASTNVYNDMCHQCDDWSGTAFPYRTQPDSTGYLVADYRCPACDHRWQCWWSIDFPYLFDPTY